MDPSPYIDTGPMGHADEETCSLSVWRGHTIFDIAVEIDPIKDTRLGQELVRQIELCGGRYPFRKTATLANPVETVYNHCLPLLEALAPQTTLQDLSLESFLHSPTYHLRVKPGANGDVRIEGENECLDTPAFFIEPLPTADLPEACTSLRQYHASETYIAPLLDKHKSASVRSVQGPVITKDGTSMYYKPPTDLRISEFERELDIMTRFDAVGLDSKVRVPRLLGTVVSGEHNEVTIGILMTMVSGCHLASSPPWGMPELHKKWEEQIIAITQELHAHGIVWGDVNPHNIMIDEDLNAWAIDFGGMNNVQFVDEENRETVKGDEQGIRRLFGEWLPERAEDYREGREAPKPYNYLDLT